MRHWLLALLALWLGVNLVLLATEGVDRVRHDWSTRGLSPGEKRAAAWGDLDGAAAWSELEEQLAVLRAAEHERVLFAVGPRSGRFVPLAHHLLYPTQVLEEPRTQRSRAELRAVAEARGASLVLLRDATGAWTTFEVGTP